MNTEATLAIAAAKAGMDEKTARKYRRSGKLPNECRAEHTWRTRQDPFDSVWGEIADRIKDAPGLQAKTLFEDLQRRFPGEYQDGQLRTFQRRIKHWRATQGPDNEIFFPQVHTPGVLGASDFTHMTRLGVTLCGQPFAHLLYHFVLTYSNWETGSICFAECFESLSEGLQNALWELGGVPKQHRTDCLTAAVKLENPEEFTRVYQGLLSHYRLQGIHGQPHHGNENGDVEQRHRRFKEAVDQALLLRGSRDFESRAHYQSFLTALFRQLNAGRRTRFLEEVTALAKLPLRKLETARRFDASVTAYSTIRVRNNTYSVPARLIGESVEVRLGSETVEVWYAQRRIDTMPRLRGEGRHAIRYRHVIDWLVRKPGAFANYRYREDLFPTSRFRMAYDQMLSQAPSRASRCYLAVLELAAKESEAGVDDALRYLLEHEEQITFEAVEALLRSAQQIAPVTAVSVAPVDLAAYDTLLSVRPETAAAR
ncbi:MAG: IS21 family transposase [Thermoanaerobaculia bacterium]